MECSAPIAVKHTVHVDFSSESGFKGLPPDWEALMKTGALTKDDVKENSDAVLDVLNFGAQYMDNQKSREGTGKKNAVTHSAATVPAGPAAKAALLAAKEKELQQQMAADPGGYAQDGNVNAQPAAANTADHPLPDEKQVTLSDLINKSDPTRIYPNLKKIGEGAAGEVYMGVSQATGVLLPSSYHVCF